MKQKIKSSALTGVAQGFGWASSYRLKGCQFNSESRAHAWVAGQVPSRGRARGNHTLMFPSLSLSLPLSLKINK